MVLLAGFSEEYRTVLRMVTGPYLDSTIIQWVRCSRPEPLPVAETPMKLKWAKSEAEYTEA